MIYLLNNFIIYSNIKIRNFFGCLKKIIKFAFFARLSILDFNQVVILDILVLILFSIYLGFLRSPKVSSDDISVVSSAYMMKSKREFTSIILLINILKRSGSITDPCRTPQ